MKSLGIDLGTNSIGWAIVDETLPKDQIIDCGVTLFPEGVKIEKGQESSKAAERTGFRLMRRQKFRRKLRKVETLKVLAQNNMCPLTVDEINRWLKNNEYPHNSDFIKWYKTDEKNQWEPYFLRKKCVEQNVTPFELGRALYHIAQRRGFLSNRKDSTKESDGAVKSSIENISNEKGKLTLGQYFYQLKQNGVKVRNHYTSRTQHYLEEFDKICEVQHINENLKKELYKAIFYQRPLKSQKFLVGKCTLEPNKPRCSISHFEYEEYRMLCFINNIKVSRKSTENDIADFSPLTKEEIDLIMPKFFRKSKPNFEFKDISNEFKNKEHHKCWEFNYPDYTNVSGCPVTAELMSIFGENWKDTKIDNYDIYDIWHVLFDFDNDEKLLDFAKNKLHLDDELALKFVKIRLPQGYAALSLKAIRKILVFLREGYIYSYAVFLANIPTIIGKKQFDDNKDEIIAKISQIIDNKKDANNIIILSNNCLKKIIINQDGNSFDEQWNKEIIQQEAKNLFGEKNWNNKTESNKQNIISIVTKNINEQISFARTKKIKDILLPSYRIDEEIDNYIVKTFIRQNKANLYHPSENEKFKSEKRDGHVILGSPIVDSVKNPVVMRALHQLRKLINYLILNDKIDSNTKINVELANEVNDKNMRQAINDLQRENEKENDKYRKELQNAGIVNPTNDDLRKYKLWIEQEKLCFYTGKTINFGDLFGGQPTFDFEHTIPRSLSWDNSLENLTLCDSEFNRSVKKQQIPKELPDYAEIQQRVEHCYKVKIEKLQKDIQSTKTRGGYSSQEEKDKKIQRRNKAILQLKYYLGKLNRFTISDVNSGFKNSQLNDTRMITKFALTYLKSVFDSVVAVRGEWTAEFRKQWGLQEYDEPKNRSLQTHHVADAITIACVNRGKYNLLNEVARENKEIKIKIKTPWENFANDVKEKLMYVFPKYVNKNVGIKTTKKILKDKRTGKLQLNENGEKIYLQGDSARGALHQDTFYGKIIDPTDGQIKCVVKKSIEAIKPDDIVDARLRKIYKDNIDNGIQTEDDIKKAGLLMPFTNNGRQIYVKKVRVFAQTSNPIALKFHRDISKYEYKQQYYVANDSNYMLAIYRGVDSKGKEISDYVVLNLLDAVSKKKNKEAFYPETVEKKGIILQHYKNIMVGKAVILLDNDNEDVKSFDKKTLWNRYYMVRGIANSAGQIFIKLVHNISCEIFSYEPNKTLNEYLKCRRYAHTQIKCLIECEDFIILPDGEFKFIK